MQNISMQDWWQAVDDSRAAELVSFWKHQSAGVPANVIDTRAREAVCVARDADGALVGVATAKPRRIPFLAEWLYYFRAFVVPDQRGARVGLKLLEHSKRVLNSAHAGSAGTGQDRPIGIFLELENPTLSRDGDRAIWQRTGFVYMGRTPRGLDRRVWYFDGATLGRKPKSNNG